MAVLVAHEAHQKLVEELIAEVAAYNPAVDRDLLLRAFRFAAKAHAGQHRRSGQDFVLHPLGAARICAELHLDEQTIAAALLHDVVEDTASASMRSSGSSRTSRSRRCTRASTRRSRRWSASGAPSGRSTSAKPRRS